MINISGNIYQDFINMLFYHVLINLFFNIIFLFGGVGKGWLNYFSGFRMVRLFVFLFICVFWNGGNLGF